MALGHTAPLTWQLRHKSSFLSLLFLLNYGQIQRHRTQKRKVRLWIFEYVKGTDSCFSSKSHFSRWHISFSATIMRKYLAVVSADSTCYRKTCFLDNRKPKPSQIKLSDLLLCSGHKGRYHTQFFFFNQQPLISSSNVSPFQIQSKKKKCLKVIRGRDSQSM